MKHFVNGNEISANTLKETKSIIFGGGCFWGLEKRFWELNGVVLTSVGYSGGKTENPSYEEVCSGFTGHVEVVKVDYNPSAIELKDLLKVFWEAHDPTQGMRQGNDIGSQYRSVVFIEDEADRNLVELSMNLFQEELYDNNYGTITTEISMTEKYFLAEEYHQQYLAKNPNGYCGLGGTGCKLKIL